MGFVVDVSLLQLLVEAGELDQKQHDRAKYSVSGHAVLFVLTYSQLSEGLTNGSPTSKNI